MIQFVLNGQIVTLPSGFGGGADGKSAYDIAVEQGFVGTEAEWLLSLKGSKGDKGDIGAPFAIKQIYSSIAAMMSADGEDVEVGEFVLISTDNVEDEDNAKLFVKKDSGYMYLTDLSGATGIQGPKGDDGDSPTITVTKVDGGHQVTVTNPDGTSQTFDILDGKDAEAPTTPLGIPVIPITKAEYDALSEEEKMADILYLITDTNESDATISNLVFGHTLTTEPQDGKTLVEVNTANDLDTDKTLPISVAGVDTVVGGIEAVMGTI